MTICPRFRRTRRLRHELVRWSSRGGGLHGLTDDETANGRPLRLEDAARVAAPLGDIAAGLSESVFANLFLFREVHGYRLHEGPLAHISGRTYDGAQVVLPLFEVQGADISALRRLLGADRWLYPFAERPAQALGDRYVSVWNDDDSDYVYDAERMRSFVGLKARRQQLRRFEGASSVSIRPLDDTAAAACAQTILDRWQADTAKPWAATDYAACAQALAQRNALGLFGLIVEVAGDPAGFVLASRISSDMAAVHFAKGLRRYDGVFPFMFRALAREHPDLARLNFEQDLGNPRFRQSKRSYRPLYMARKLRLRLQT